MKSYYTNNQRFDVSGRFSVEQRRFADKLRQHPNRFQTRLGPKWMRVTTLDSIAEISTAALHDLDAQFHAAFLDIGNSKIRQAVGIKSVLRQGWRSSGIFGCCHPKGGEIGEWPTDLRIREMPSC